MPGCLSNLFIRFGFNLYFCFRFRQAEVFHIEAELSSPSDSEVQKRLRLSQYLQTSAGRLPHSAGQTVPLPGDPGHQRVRLETDEPADTLDTQ